MQMLCSKYSERTDVHMGTYYCINRDCIRRDSWCMGPYAGVDYNHTLCRLHHNYRWQSYACVDLSPTPESTLSPSQGLRIWPQEACMFTLGGNSIGRDLAIFCCRLIGSNPPSLAPPPLHITGTSLRLSASFFSVCPRVARLHLFTEEGGWSQENDRKKYLDLY